MGNKKEFQIGMDKQSIGSGTIASRETEKEKQLVESSKELIQIYEKKIKDKIAAVWET